MSSKKIIKSVIVSLFSALVLLSFSDSASAADKVWILKQIEDGFKKRTVCVSNDGIKFIQGQYVLLCQAPDWKIFVLNKKRKLFIEMPRENFKGTSWMWKVPLSVSKSASESEEPIAGLKVESFESAKSASSSGDTDSVRKVFVKTTREVPIDSKKLTLIQGLFGDDLNGLPLEISVVDTKETKRDVLTTDWCLTKVVPDHFYSIPKGFSRAKSLKEIENLYDAEKFRVMKYRPFQKKTINK